MTRAGSASSPISPTRHRTRSSSSRWRRSVRWSTAARAPPTAAPATAPGSCSKRRARSSSASSPRRTSASPSSTWPPSASFCRATRTRPPRCAARIEHAVRGEGVAPMRWRVPAVDPCRARRASARRARRPTSSCWSTSAPATRASGCARCAAPSSARCATRATSPRWSARRRRPSCTRGCSRRASSAPTSPTCAIRLARRASRVFHQRFSTNTAPQLAARAAVRHRSRTTARSTRSPATAPGCGRAACSRRAARATRSSFDVALDAMVGAGYRVDEAVDLMLSPAIDDDDRLRAYYDAHVPTVEPWDGPAAIVFAEGDRVGAALDRSGFRPLRWCRTESGKVLAASEAGVVDFGDDPIVERGRLGPGERIVVRFATGELIAPGRVSRAAPRERRLPRDRRVVAVRAAARGAARRSTPRAAARSGALRLHAGRAQAASCRSLAGGASRCGRWATTPRWRSSSAACRSPNICASGSRKSRTRRSTRCAKASCSTCARGSAAATTNGDVPAPGSIVTVDTALLDEGAFDALTYDARLVPHRIALDCGAELAARAHRRDRATMPSARCATARPTSCSTTAARRCRSRRSSPPAPSTSG